MDLSKLSDSDLMALQTNDLSKVSNEGLQHLHSQLQSVQHPNMHMEQGDWVKNAPIKSPIGSNITENLGNLWEASKLEGLAPEVNPIGGVASMPITKTAEMTAVGLANAAKNSTIGQKLGAILSKMGEAGKGLAQLPAELTPSNVKSGYAIGRADTPYLSKQYAIGKAEGMPEGEGLGDGVKNWLKAMFGENANINEVNKAKDMSSGYKDVLAAQLLENKAKQLGGRGNYTLPSNASIMLPEELQVKPGQFTGTNARRIGNEATWFPNAATLGDVLKTKSHLIGLLSSPRINTNLGYATGKGVSAASKAIDMLPQASLEDLINAGILDARTMNKGEQ
jgi:hypothetical protein